MSRYSPTLDPAIIWEHSGVRLTPELPRVCAHAASPPLPAWLRSWWLSIPVKLRVRTVRHSSGDPEPSGEKKRKRKKKHAGLLFLPDAGAWQSNSAQNRRRFAECQPYRRSKASCFIPMHFQNKFKRLTVFPSHDKNSSGTQRSQTRSQTTANPLNLWLHNYI